MRVTVIQFKPSLLNPQVNRKIIEKKIISSPNGIIIFPELATSGYAFKTKKELKIVAEPAMNGPTANVLRSLAQKKKSMIITGFPESDRGNYFNSALIATPSKIFCYRKIHLFWNEKKFFSPGNRPFFTVPFYGVRVGTMICFDWLFPEAARTLALKKADLIAHPSNLVLPNAPKGMITRSLENRVFTATANRIGLERGLRFTGLSQIVDPKGRVLAHLNATQTGRATTTIHPRLARNKHITPTNNIFADRAQHLYYK